METAETIARMLSKVMRFRYLTVDRYSVKLWRRQKPMFCHDGGFWVGTDSCGFLDLEDVRIIAPLKYSTAIVEVV